MRPLGPNGKEMSFCFEALQSEPSLWRLMNAKDQEDATVYALLMTYVDDILVAAPSELFKTIQVKFQSAWSTSRLEGLVHLQSAFLEL